MQSPRVLDFALKSGRFRALEWAGDRGIAVFLHGLSGVAEVWGPTVEALGGERPQCIAIDQRGHGQSPHPTGTYAVSDYVEDVEDLVGLLGGPVRLVGHSMGARVAMVAASRRPELFRSVAVVDIGPERWQANIDETVVAFEQRPERFANREEAIAHGSRGRRDSLDAERFLLPRLHQESDGSYRWLAPHEALIETVRRHRSRNYWAEWARIRIPLLLVRGERSRELRPWIAARMRARNGCAEFREIEGVGHNIPLLAPGELATALRRFWESAEQPRA